AHSKMRALGFNPTEIQKRIIELHNEKMLPIKVKNLKDFFKKGEFYANTVVKEMLNYQNYHLSIKTESGQIYENEPATNITRYLGSNTVICTREINESGTRARGYRIK